MIFKRRSCKGLCFGFFGLYSKGEKYRIQRDPTSIKKGGSLKIHPFSNYSKNSTNMNTREEKTLLIPFLVHGIINNKKLKTRYFIILKNSNMENTKKNFDIVWKEIMQDAEDLDSYNFREKRSKELED
jgi:hypothetical protein